MKPSSRLRPARTPRHVGRWGAMVVVLGCVAGAGVSSKAKAPRARDVVSAAPAFKTNDAGERLMWQEQKLTIAIDPSVSALGPQAYDAALRGFGVWLGNGYWLPQLSFEQTTQPLGKPAYDGRNTVSFGAISEPGHERDVAYTITYVDQKNGEIVEADVVLNSAYQFAVLDEGAMGGMDTGQSCVAGGSEKQSCEAGYDIQNVLAHEAGHFFGLGEDREQPGATMFQCTGRCEVHKRELEASDAQTMSELYGGERTVTTSTPACAAAPGAVTRQSGAFWLSAAAALMLAGRRRRRQ
jgi:hypothetical protein